MANDTPYRTPQAEFLQPDPAIPVPTFKDHQKVLVDHYHQLISDIKNNEWILGHWTAHPLLCNPIREKMEHQKKALNALEFFLQQFNLDLTPPRKY